jgi:murein L,D-transpeptidase YafK
MKKTLIAVFVLLLACTSVAYAYDRSTQTGTQRGEIENVAGKEIVNASDTPLLNSGQPLADIAARIGDVTEIRVNKTSLTLTLFHKKTPLKTYHVAIGEAGFADKVKQGDKATPEGTFYITEKSILNNDYFLGTRWMRVSYPNIEDAWRGYNTGLITRETRDAIINAINNGETPPQNTALGGGVGIHGGSGNNAETQGDFWTYGCIGLKDSDVNEIYPLITIKNTKLVIEH